VNAFKTKRKPGKIPLWRFDGIPVSASRTRMKMKPDRSSVGIVQDASQYFSPPENLLAEL